MVYFLFRRLVAVYINDYLCVKLSRVAYRIRFVCDVVDLSIVTILYFVHIQSRMTYVIIFWGNRVHHFLIN